MAEATTLIKSLEKQKQKQNKNALLQCEFFILFRLCRNLSRTMRQKFVVYTNNADAHSLIRFVDFFGDFLNELLRFQATSNTKTNNERIRIQNTQDIERTLFNWTKQDKTCKFSLFSSDNNLICNRHSKYFTFVCSLQIIVSVGLL